MSRPAYFIAHYDITDPDRYEQEYVPAIAAQLAAAGGEVVVATGSAEPLEGRPGSQTVVIRFPSHEALAEWYHGEAYAPLRELRLGTTANGVALAAGGFRSG